ncbi:MAG: ATP-binding protein, partial [Candidatus Omnitrophica bacterium]|nr:ATP-binding protein [Candidatus Omnitrophota bacterium]
VSFFGRRWLMVNFGQNWGFPPLILLTILASIGPFLYIYFQRRAETIILRKQRAYQETLKQAARELSRIHNLKKLLNLITHIVTKTVGITHAAIYLLEEESQDFVLKATRNKKNKTLPMLINKESLLIEWLKNHREILVYEEIHRKAYEGSVVVLKELDNQMKSLDASIIVPGFIKEKLLGFLILGDKRLGEFYTPQDLDTLSVIANQAALAIENATLYENMEEEVKQRTEELIETQRQLVQAEKLATVGTLAGGVAHEINNPLTAVLTNVQMLLADSAKLDTETKESLELIEEATKRCRMIVQKLMTYAKKPLETAIITEINLLEVVEKVVDFLRYQFLQDNVKIDIQAKEKKYRVKANFNEMEQVVTNLLLNARDAIKQIKKHGQINISLHKTDTEVSLEVKDDGCGISKEIISKIFDPFFTTKDVGKGTGLGLSICHSIVEKYKGVIAVQSEPTKGSTFVVQLPGVESNK